MPQFQIRRHPHSGTWIVIFLNNGKPTQVWNEGNSVQDCIDEIVVYIQENTWIIINGIQSCKFHLEVLPD